MSDFELSIILELRIRAHRLGIRQIISTDPRGVEPKHNQHLPIERDLDFQMEIFRRTGKDAQCQERRMAGRDLAFLFVQLRFDGRLNLVVKRLVVLQNFFRSVPALGKLRPFIIQPGTPLLDDLFFQRDIEKSAG